jgi:octaprenyl-diphosphate synthase
LADSAAVAVALLADMAAPLLAFVADELEFFSAGTELSAGAAGWLRLPQLKFRAMMDATEAVIKSGTERLFFFIGGRNAFVMMPFEPENSSQTAPAKLTGLTRRAAEFNLTPMLAAVTKLPEVKFGHATKSAPACSWKKIVEPVEPFLQAVTQQLVRQARDFDPQIVPYAEHALNGSGKHLRPTLVSLAAACFGKPSEAHVKAAVIIEMIHLATLVHDDVMDEAEIRRGSPTVAAKWGNEIAVLFGDCLFAQALKLAASFPTTEVCRAVSTATNTVCTGEIIQTQQRRNFIASRRDYFRVIEMKTGELFTLSCDLAAYLSSATDEQRAALKEFGAAFGTAYQVYDDCVDLFGTEAEAGKSLGTDLAKGKLTWPLLLAWERAEAKERAELESVIKNWQPENFPFVNGLLAKHEVFEPSLREIEKFLEQARRALRVLPVSPGRNGLSQLTDFLAQQTSALVVQ